MSSGVKCLSQTYTPFFYLFWETWVDNSVSRYNVQWRLSPAFLVFLRVTWNFKNTDPLVFWLSWHATPKYWAVCFRHRLIYSVSVMAVNFQRAPLMSRDDLNFRAITYSPKTGPFPDTPLERLCLKVKVQEKNASFREQESPLPLVDPCAKICTAYSYCNERAKSTFQLYSLFWKN